ncbi:hypothetical protein DdX_05267 [Ditylenchus destructor]|uniref:Uncharacterized protein n=1 Tax=Ditylenchus destructor TaxID=166010 RepID=A0AAD4R7I1_9BILA|nr:hypothetical protein DdX_05267 [Ditylenchus destructor]
MHRDICQLARNDRDQWKMALWSYAISLFLSTSSKINILVQIWPSNEKRKMQSRMTSKNKVVLAFLSETLPLNPYFRKDRENTKYGDLPTPQRKVNYYIGHGNFLRLTNNNNKAAVLKQKG